ncbi:GNAT family N-acetyltransferase, partial [Mycobacterium sp. ITM-2017-0098]
MSEIDVRFAQKPDVKELARVLGRAFFDDPVMMWMVPDDAKR